MANKGVIDKDIIAGNEYQLVIDGNVTIICTEISGLDEALQTVELPDGTNASGGRTEGGLTFTIMVPHHHVNDIAYMEAWWNSCKDPIPPSAYKTASVITRSKSQQIVRTSTTFGTFVSNRKGPDLSLSDGGSNMNAVEYTLMYDDANHS